MYISLTPFLPCTPRSTITSLTLLSLELSLTLVVFLDNSPTDVLVAPQRQVERFADLSGDEVADMFGCVHRIAPVLERVYSATSLSIVVQDGIDAGQSVKHVHVHLLPRKPGDFARNDDIYDAVSAQLKAILQQCVDV